MATRTRIKNISQYPLILPPPYAGVLPAGQGAVVADSLATVIAALGGASFEQKILLIESMPSATSLTTHANGLGGLRIASAQGSNGAGAVAVSATPANVKVNDQVAAVLNITDHVNLVPGTDFESAVSVAGQVQQLSASNLSAKTLVFFVIAKS